jgi:hypothetical protein
LFGNRRCEDSCRSAAKKQHVDFFVIDLCNLPKK